MTKKTVLSGIRATGRLHLGNYLGAMRHFVTLSKSPDHQCYFFVANLHTLTTLPEPDEIRRFLPEIVLDYVAAGIDPEQNAIYAQSSVPETSELTVLLSNMVSHAYVARTSTYKERLQNEPHNVSVGLFNYPVLMAADILGPQADLVPVGEDQLQHVEAAREIARRFNDRFGKVFQVPEPLEREALRVPGLDGTGKMGKSEGNTLNLSDTPDEMWDKLKVAVTDTNRVRRKDPGNPSKCKIFSLHTMVSSDEQMTWAAEGCRSAGIGCFDCKKVLHENLVNLLTPFQERRAEVAEKKGYVEEILHEGGKQARKVIAETTAKARDAMGIDVF